MIDPVLQSFCERCGKRFGPASPRDAPEKPEAPPAGVLGRLIRRTPEGSQPSSLPEPPSGEALGEALHFCLECRRYNCADCWNAEEGYCVSCRPPGMKSTVVTAQSLSRAGLRASTKPSFQQPVAWPSDARAPSDSGSTDQGPASGSDDASGPSAELDEWGRPRSGQVAGASSRETEASSWTPVTDLDPWRGVVFSAEDGTTADTPPGIDTAASSPEPASPPSPVTSGTWPASDSPAGSTAAGTWPERDRRSAPEQDDGTSEPEQSDPDHQPVERSPQAALAGLADSDANVDAVSWARASAAVVGRGSLIAAAPAPEVEEPVVTAEAEAVPVSEALEAAEELAETEEPATTAEVEERAAAEGSAEIAEVEEPAAVAEPAEIAEVEEPAEGPAAEPAEIEEPVAVEEPAAAAELEPPLLPWPSETQPAPPPLTPIAPPPALEVWRLPVEHGPFSQPYQPPAVSSGPVVTSLPPVPGPPQPSSVTSQPASTPADAPSSGTGPASMATPPPVVPPPSVSPPQPGVARQPVAPGRSQPASHACASCGLPLSSKARFCRRCGAPQPG